MKVDNDRLIRLITETLDFTPASLRGGGYLSQYRSRSILTGKDVAFTQNGVNYTGNVLGVDERYRLVVAVEGGIMTLDSGEVSVAAI